MKGVKPADFEKKKQKKETETEANKKKSSSNYFKGPRGRGFPWGRNTMCSPGIYEWLECSAGLFPSASNDHDMREEKYARQLFDKPR